MKRIERHRAQATFFDEPEFTPKQETEFERETGGGLWTK
jgi:hypothetical protein